jgi:hypothetical protein
MFDSKGYPNIKHGPLKVLALTQFRLTLELDLFWQWLMLGQLKSLGLLGSRRKAWFRPFAIQLLSRGLKKLEHKLWTK